MKKTLILCLGLTIAFSGCATMGLQQTLNPTAISSNRVRITMNVYLDRAFVRSNSGFGAGAVAMWLLVGPFNNDKINIYGTIKEKTGEEKTVGTFSKGLNWGENIFNIEAPKNSQIKLMLSSGGTRAGSTDLGYADVGNDPTQTISVKLTSAGAQIE